MSEEQRQNENCCEQLRDLLTSAVRQDASDIFLIPGMPAAFKIHGQIHSVDGRKLTPADTHSYVNTIYHHFTDGRSMERVLETGDDDFSFAVDKLSRFRASILKQRGSLAAVIRVVQFDLPSPESLHIPESIINLSQFTKGLVLVTGPAGSGKSTTLACIIDRINHTRNASERSAWTQTAM